MTTDELFAQTGVDDSVNYEWLPTKSESLSGAVFVCPCCHECVRQPVATDMKKPMYRYCPYCGTRMRKTAFDNEVNQ